VCSPARLTSVVIGLLLMLVATACGTNAQRPRSRPTVSTNATASCAASSLTVSGTWQGATGSMLGGISFTNTGSVPCRLPGYPKIELVSQSGQDLLVQVRLGQPGSAVLPAGTVVKAAVLPPGKPNSASEMLQWSNWCGAFPGTLALDVVLPDREKVTATPVRQPWGVPRCDETAAASVLYEGPIQLS
jgi:hypothetical protein